MLTYIFSLILVSVTFCFSIIIKNKEIVMPVIIYNIIWNIITIASSMGITGVSRPTEKIYIMVILSNISINLGFLIFIKGKTKEKISLNHPGIYISEKKVFCLLITLFLVIVFFMRKTIGYIISGDLSTIRNMVYKAEVGSENSLYSSGVETVLVQWITNSLITALLILVIVLYLNGLCKFRLLVLTLILAIFYALLTGGRMMLFKSAIIIIAAILILKWKNIGNIKLKIKKNIKKRKAILIFLIFLILICGILFTSFRSSENFDNEISFFETFLNYLINPLSYLSFIVIPELFVSGYFLGAGGIGGVFRPFTLIFENLMGTRIMFPADIIVAETQYFVDIGGGQVYNALPTMLYAFYRDGGLLGIIINSFTFGSLISFSYNRYRNKGDVRSSAVYLLLVYLIFMGILRWEPSFVNFWLTFLFIIIFTTKKRIIINSK